MKIAMFGATGRVGGEVLKKALADGYEVITLARTPSKLDKHELLTVVEGDIRNKSSVESIISGSDFVFSAIGTDKTTTLTEAIPHVIQAMKQEKLSRIVTIGTAGILQSRTTPDLLRYEARDSNRKLTFAAEEHHKVYELLDQSQLEWTIVCPTYLPDGPAEGDYRIEKDYLPIDGKKITVGDTVAFAYEELTDKNYVRSRVGIAY